MTIGYYYLLLVPHKRVHLNICSSGIPLSLQALLVCPRDASKMPFY